MELGQIKPAGSCLYTLALGFLSNAHCQPCLYLIGVDF